LSLKTDLEYEKQQVREYRSFGKWKKFHYDHSKEYEGKKTESEGWHLEVEEGKAPLVLRMS
jgi:hypothetical protein